MSYTKINPDLFKVRDAINLLNSNVDYIYNTANQYSSKNIIPNADFSIVSNLDYWKPFGKTELLIKDSMLEASSDSIIGVVSPVFSEKVKSYTKYTLLVKAKASTNLSFTKCYLLKSDGSTVDLSFYHSIDKDMSSYTLVFTTDEDIVNGRLVLISENPSSNLKEVFEYSNSLSEVFVYNGLLLRDVDLDNIDTVQDPIIYIKDSIIYAYLNEDIETINNLISKRVKDGDVRIIPSNYEKGYYVNSILEEVLTALVCYKLNLPIESFWDNIFYYYNISKVKGAFPLLTSSNEYSIVISYYVLRLIELVLVDSGDFEKDGLYISDIRNSILSFVRDNITNICGEYLKGAFEFTDSETGGSKEWFYLDSTDSLSETSLGFVSQIDLLNLLNLAGRDTSLYEDKLNSFAPLYPVTINERGTSSNSSALSLIAYHLYKSGNEPDYNGYILNTLLSYKQENGLYKSDLTSASNTYSCYQFLEKLIDGDVYTPYSTIYFDTIAIGEGTSSNIESRPSDSYNQIVESIKGATLDIGEDTIAALVRNNFVSKNYFNCELQSVYEKIEQASIDIDMDSIVTSVTNSESFINLTDDLNDVKEKVTLNSSSIKQLSDSIDMNIKEQNYLSVIRSTVSMGYNLINNSNFLEDNSNWEVTGSTVSFKTSSLDKTYIHLDTATSVTLIQKVSTLLYSGSYVLGLESLGSGSFTLSILSEGEVLASAEVSPLSTSARYYLSFKVPDVTEVSIQISSNQCNLDISYLKLCRGDKDYGWSPSADDLETFYKTFIVSYSNIKDNSSKIVAKEVSTGPLILDLKKDANLYFRIATEILNHPILTSSFMYSRALSSLNTYYVLSSDLASYLENDIIESKLLSEELNSYYEAYLDLSSNLIEVCNYISHFDVQVADSKGLEALRGELEDVDNSIADLSDTLTNSFKDGIVTSEEKAKIRESLSAVEREKSELDTKVTYYTSDEKVASSEEGVELISIYNNYQTAYNDLVSQVETILNSEKVTEDMKYSFNTKYDLYSQQSELLQSQLLVVASKFYNNQFQTEISSIDNKVNDLSSKVTDLEGLIGASSSDGVLTTLEKRDIENSFRDITRNYLLIKSEIDYYQGQQVLVETIELEDLNAAEEALDTDYTNLKTAVETLLESTEVTQEDIDNINTHIDSLDETLKIVKECLAACLIKISTVTTGGDVSGLITDLRNLSDKVGSLTNFTDQAFVDGILSYTETINITDMVDTISKEQEGILQQVEELSKNEYLKDTEYLQNLISSSTNLEVAFNELQESLNSLIEDGRVDSTEKESFNTCKNNYYLALNNLNKAISDAEAYIDNKRLEANLSASKEYIDGQITDVNTSISNITNFTDQAFVDGIISTSEKSSFKTLLDSLYKENLDVMKQIEVYTSPTLTPELQGTTEFSNLVTLRTSYSNAYKAFYNTIENIVNNTGVTVLDKTNYNRDKEVYENKLLEVREALLNCTNKISAVKVDNSLHYTDDTGTVVSVVDWVKDANISLTKEGIKQYVEETSTVLVTKEHLDGNYIDKETSNKTYATRSDIQQLSDSITSTVKTTDMETYKKEWLDSSKEYVDGLEYGGSNLVLNSNFWANLAKWVYDSNYVSVVSTPSHDGHNTAKIITTGLTDTSYNGISQVFLDVAKSGAPFVVSFWYYIKDKSVFDNHFSIELKTDTGGSTVIDSLVVEKDSIVENTWTRVSKKMSVKKACKDLYVYLFIKGNGELYVTDIQVERGNVLTDWGPCGKDYEEEFVSVKTSMSQIKQTSDRISLLVSVNDQTSELTLTEGMIKAISSSDILLSSKQITLEGIVTANESFKILTDGSVEMEDLSVDGQISANSLVINEINNSKYPLALDGDYTVYINESGTDSEEFGDEAVYSSVESFMNNCPRNFNGYTLKIKLQSDVNSNMEFERFYGGLLELYLEGYTVYGHFYFTNPSMKYEFISGSGGSITPGKGYAGGTGRCAIFSEYTTTTVRDVKVYAPSSSSANYGIGYYLANGRVVKTSFVNCSSAVKAYTSSRVHCSETAGSTSSYAFSSNSGSIISFSADQNCGRKDSTKHTQEYSNGKIWSDGATFVATEVEGTNTPPAVVETVTKTVTVKASYGDTYRRNVYKGWKKDGTVRQGDYGYGDCDGLWFFGTALSSALSKGTTKSVSIKIRRQQGGVYGDVTHTLVGHKYTSRSSGAPTIGSTITTFSIAVGESITLKLTSDQIKTLKNYKGIGLHSTYNSSHYSVCSGSCTIEVTYTTTA